MKAFLRGMRVLALGVVVAMGVLTLQVHQAPSAHASAGCKATGCNDLDPYQLGCTADAYAAGGTYSDSIGWIRTWYSPACQANWLQAGTPLTTYEIIGFSLRDNESHPITYCEGTNYSALYYCVPQATQFWVNDIAKGARQWYTNMISGTYAVDGAVTFHKVSAAEGSGDHTLNGGWH